MKLRTLTAIMLIAAAAATVRAQMFSGMEGLINTPSAEMQPAGEAMIGMYYMNSRFLPGNDDWQQSVFMHHGKGYNTCDFYASLTPFPWIEFGYTFTLLKTDEPKTGYNQKDRYFSLKLRPLKEGKWLPAVAVGSTDILASFGRLRRDNHASGYFSNFYVVATKHFNLGGELGANIAYRHSRNPYCDKWQGVVGGVTWRPQWVPDLRAIAEWTGNEVNIGADYLLWRHLFMQATLVRCKHFSGGICYRVNLF